MQGHHRCVSSVEGIEFASATNEGKYEMLLNRERKIISKGPQEK
jgi:hypothetical protein